MTAAQADRDVRPGMLNRPRVMRRALATVIPVLAALLLATGVPPLFAEELPKKIPVQLTADNLDYDRTNDIYTAAGHVRMEQKDLYVQADRVVLNNRTGDAVAEGNVYVRDKGDTLLADRIELNVNTREGVITNGKLYLSKENLHLKGEKIERRSEQIYHLDNGVLTTCDDEEWFIKARQMDIDMDRYATGNDVSFNMGGVPVLYSPYLLFPVRRQSGLLIPEIGFSSTEGFLMKNALFWAISDSKDMTFYSDYRSTHGIGTGVEFRYVNSRDSAGKAYYNFFESYHGEPQHWELQFQHREEFAEDLTFRADIDLVNNWDYFRDLDTAHLEVKARPYVDSNAFYTERWNTATLYLLGQYTTDLTGSNDATIQKAPELRYDIFGETIGKHLYFRFEGRANNFTSERYSSLLRADLNPELDGVVSGHGLSFTPRVGARATFYDQSATTFTPTDRTYVYAGADLNARFSRVYGTDTESGIGLMRHSIEPTLSYSYIPRVDQGDLPQLDAVDRVQEQNLVTVSLINRLTARYKEGSVSRTFDLMVFRLSESYDVQEARNAQLAEPHPRSALTAELALKTPKLFTLSATENYNTYTKRLISSSESVVVTGDLIQLELADQYLRDPRTRYVVAGLGTKIDPWTLHYQIWRDMEHRITTQQEYKVHYASQCWGLALRYQVTPGERQITLVLDLKGLGAMKL